jgi:hypothetical protein
MRIDARKIKPRQRLGRATALVKPRAGRARRLSEHRDGRKIPTTCHQRRRGRDNNHIAPGAFARETFAEESADLGGHRHSDGCSPASRTLEAYFFDFFAAVADFAFLAAVAFFAFTDFAALADFADFALADFALAVFAFDDLAAAALGFVVFTFAVLVAARAISSSGSGEMIGVSRFAAISKRSIQLFSTICAVAATTLRKRHNRRLAGRMIRPMRARVQALGFKRSAAPQESAPRPDQRRAERGGRLARGKAGRRELARARAMTGAEDNVEDREERREVLVVVLGQSRMMDAMELRTNHGRPERPRGEAQIHVREQAKVGAKPERQDGRRGNLEMPSVMPTRAANSSTRESRSIAPP